MLEPIENQYLLIGYINRAHGVKGEVMIISDIYAPALFDKIDLVHLQNSRGDLIPARVLSVRSSESNNRLSFFVQFEHIADRNEAEQLKGFAIYVDRESAEDHIEETEQPEDYTAFKVYDNNNKYFGKVEEVLDSPAHPILQIITERGRQVLVPFVDEYIVAVENERNIIRSRNLDQLEDL